MISDIRQARISGSTREGKLMKNTWKRITMIALFYLINFGLWEIIAPVISNEWASFVVYVILFGIVIMLFYKELKEEWKAMLKDKLSNKKFYLGLLIVLIVDLFLSVVVLQIANIFPQIMPANNENVKTQMASVPIILTVIQGCIFAPVIEEMTFRYGIIGKPRTRHALVILTILSIILFDCIHIVTVPEFFYYIAPAVILTLFYVRHRNVFASIMLHSLINIVGYLALLVGVM